jgi:hypothetical protein
VVVVVQTYRNLELAQLQLDSIPCMKNDR